MRAPGWLTVEGCIGAAKRVLDLSCASVALVALSPLMLAVAATIRVTMGRPVLLRQRRIGKHGSLFRLYKFRTMTEGRDGAGVLLPDQQRLTPVGRLLRSASLDELPQLWNVLKADMSLVGPRPLLPEYLPRYNAWQRRRHEVKPGITGWAQVHGRNNVSWEEKFAFDVWYVDHHGFWLDLKILLLTILQVLRRDGISRAGHATAPEFLGTRHLAMK